jgi:hypothetical protein
LRTCLVGSRRCIDSSRKRSVGSRTCTTSSCKGSVRSRTCTVGSRKRSVDSRGCTVGSRTRFGALGGHGSRWMSGAESNCRGRACPCPLGKYTRGQAHPLPLQ